MSATTTKPPAAHLIGDGPLRARREPIGTPHREQNRPVAGAPQAGQRRSLKRESYSQQ
jgi:hypothetical protein